MTVSPEAVRPAATKAPNYWLGFFLNWLLVGSGFTYLGALSWHFIWLGLSVVGWVAGTLLLAVAAGQSPASLSGAALVVALVSLAAFVLMLVQYRQTYRRLYGRGRTASPITDGLHWGLIGGHGALGLFGRIALTGILAAVLIPNLLNARNRALVRTHGLYLSEVYRAVAAADAMGELRPDDCSLGAGRFEVRPPADALFCTVDRRDPSRTGVIVTFRGGQTLRAP